MLGIGRHLIATGSEAAPTFKTGNVSQLHELNERIVAIQSCDLDPRYPGPELITLSSKKVAVFRADSRFLTRLADVNIRRLPKSPSISRFPHGYILCPRTSEATTKVIKLGHSNFAHGVNIVVNAAGKLKLRASSSGQAIMLSEKNDKLLASYTAGRPWWGQFSPTIKQPTEVIGFLAPFEGEASQGFVLSRDYKLFSLDTKLQASTTRITSGAGISTYQNQQQELRFITTSSISAQTKDRIRVQTREGKILHEISTPLPVMTTTSLPSEEKGATRILFASPRLDQGRTTIFHIEVSDP